MNNPLESLSSEASAVHLTDEERSMGRMGMSHMFAVQPYTGHGRHWYSRPALMATIISVLTLSLVGGGVVLAAEGTVPGDQLYPIKIHVTEGIQTALNMSAQARAGWEVRRLERRLEEVETLVQRKSGQGQNVAAAVDAQAKRLRKQLERLQQSGESETADNVGEDAAASLNAHEQVLTELTKDENNDSVGHEVVRSIKAHQQTASEPGAGPNTSQAATGKQRAAQQKIAEVRRWLEKNSDRFETSLLGTARTKLAAAQTAWDDGKEKLAAESFVEAFRQFQQAQRLAQEAKVFLAAHQRLQHQAQNNKNSGGQVVNGQTSAPGLLMRPDKP